MRHHITIAALLLTILFTGLQVNAQNPFHVVIPGKAFTPGSTGHPQKAIIEDIEGGRRFRGKAFQRLILTAPIQMHPSSSADHKLKRLVIHFRTSRWGPSLQTVEVLDGTVARFKIETRLEGDYATQEVVKPESLANVWSLREPISVNSHSIIRLEVQFPGGFDSKVDPGDFVIIGVELDFPLKLMEPKTGVPSTIPDPLKRSDESTSKPPASSLTPTGVIYVLSENNDLIWYNHSGREDGSFKWTYPAGRTIGKGWNFRQVFQGDENVFYAITFNGDLLWYRHDGWSDGSFRWSAAEGKKIATGWDFKYVFSGGGGVIYGITFGGNLMWFRHDGWADGSSRWATPEGKMIGTGWEFKHVFSGGNGVIYAITDDGDLMWFHHDGHDDGSSRWAFNEEGKKVGSGWNVKDVFSGGNGVMYTVMLNGDLIWFRHDGRNDGSPRWASNGEGKKVGSGWNFKQIFSH
jgi:hypothetical protein